MISFTCTIRKFGSMGEKTGWTYIDIPKEVAEQMVPNNKKAFRVKGFFDEHSFEGISLVPMGGGDFILALNATIRKIIRKGEGAMLHVKIEKDEKQTIICAELLECLADEPAAQKYFLKLPKSHQNYYSRWIESAKSEQTKAKRIAQAVTACARQQHYGEMIRSLKEENKKLLG